ncbi:hypothetical protein [Pseudoponticoccus marisrubri]|uniref:Uncharacterized protein n=1 Tax=Pseudoponticoccus marisrubri TaxID=1685382 RepID=A0A0W7WP50_9RHOB|nr:hypothetical protein [Pseudoponticoccus marisrubri]KUF12363.1 hypothetical protein AVJ23_01120 [Pseudoponticoccus marisrubri]
MSTPVKDRPAKWGTAGVLIAGFLVAVLGFLTGAIGFGLSLALCFLIWIGGTLLLNRHRVRQDARLRNGG